MFFFSPDENQAVTLMTNSAIPIGKLMFWASNKKADIRVLFVGWRLRVQ
jgi:hypothetical protein